MKRSFSTGPELQWISVPWRLYRRSSQLFSVSGSPPTVEEVRKPMGMLKWDHVHTMLQMDRISSEGRESTDVPGKSRCGRAYGVSETSILDILKDFVEPKPFVLEAVNQLRERGIKIGSTTGYTRQMMEIVTEEAKKRICSGRLFYAGHDGK